MICFTSWLYINYIHAFHNNRVAETDKHKQATAAYKLQLLLKNGMPSENKLRMSAKSL